MLYYTTPYCIVLWCTCKNMTSFAMKTILRCHIREFEGDKSTCCLFKLTLMWGLCSITRSCVLFSEEDNLLWLAFPLLRNFIVPVAVQALDSSRSCGLACFYDDLPMKHSSTALLISQFHKFSHKSLATLWLLVSF